MSLLLFPHLKLHPSLTRCKNDSELLVSSLVGVVWICPWNASIIIHTIKPIY